jgi:hypothetical protein
MKNRMIAILSLALVLTIVCSSLVATYAVKWNGSYIEAYWVSGKKILEIHITKNDLVASGYTQTMTLVNLLKFANALNSAATGTIQFLVKALELAGTNILVARTRNADGSVNISLAQIWGNFVYAYYGFYPKHFPLCPIPLYVSTVAIYPTPSFTYLVF